MSGTKRALIFEDVAQAEDGTTNDIVAVMWDRQETGEAGVTLKFWLLNKPVQILLSLDDLRKLIELTEE